VARILFVYSRRASFIELDRDLLRERWEVSEWYQPGLVANLPALVRAVRGCDLVFGWWASWHTLSAISVAWLFRKRSVLVVGGVDVANMPEIGYGRQRGGLRRWTSRWTMRRASRLMTNSEYSRREVADNIGIDDVTVVYHGVPDAFGELSGQPRERLAITVGNVDRPNLERKGLRPFVEAARHLPGVSFVLAGRWDDDAIDRLRALASDNVLLTGWIPQEELEELFRRAGAYVQASRHEGFGFSVAEAMLAGCVPVVTKAGALPEVVGDAGIELESDEPEELARGVLEALEVDATASERARRRVQAHFPVEVRRRGLHSLIEEELDKAGVTSTPRARR
jgi:glycosyltransferase involved in cell wall biosynthesis